MGGHRWRVRWRDARQQSQGLRGCGLGRLDDGDQLHVLGHREQVERLQRLQGPARIEQDTEVAVNDAGSHAT